MYQKMWVSDQRKNLICVDSYDGGVMQGRFYDDAYECIPFGSLSQFLLSMDRVLDDKHLPESYTEPRVFTQRPVAELGEVENGLKRGKKATFELCVMFRQNTSWQGSLRWREKGIEQSFRSVLELIFLLDSALQDQ